MAALMCHLGSWDSQGAASRRPAKPSLQERGSLLPEPRHAPPPRLFGENRGRIREPGAGPAGPGDSPAQVQAPQRQHPACRPLSRAGVAALAPVWAFLLPAPRAWGPVQNPEVLTPEEPPAQAERCAAAQRSRGWRFRARLCPH